MSNMTITYEGTMPGSRITGRVVSVSATHVQVVHPDGDPWRYSVPRERVVAWHEEVDGTVITIPANSDPVTDWAGHEGHDIEVDLPVMGEESEDIVWCHTCDTTLAYHTEAGWEMA